VRGENIASYNGDNYGGGLCLEKRAVAIREDDVIRLNATWTGGTFGKVGGST